MADGVLQSEAMQQLIETTVSRVLHRRAPGAWSQNKWHKKGRKGKGGEFGSGIVIEPFCSEEPGEGELTVQMKTLGSGCGEVPGGGVDDNDDYVTVEDPCDRMAGYTPDELRSAEVEVWYEYILDECRPRWRLLAICGVDECPENGG